MLSYPNAEEINGVASIWWQGKQFRTLLVKYQNILGDAKLTKGPIKISELIKMKADRTSKPPWRNWLARSAVNRKVGGSSPPGGALFLSGFTGCPKMLTLAGLEPAIP